MAESLSRAATIARDGRRGAGASRLGGGRGWSPGEWVYEEGCLSVPGLSFEIVRPDEVHLTGLDLDGNEVSIEASELMGRLFQHELDHLDGVLLLERLEPAQRKEALRALRQRTMGLDDGRRDRAHLL